MWAVSCSGAWLLSTVQYLSVGCFLKCRLGCSVGHSAAVLCGLLDACIAIQLMIITAEESPAEAQIQIELFVLLFPEWIIVRVMLPEHQLRTLPNHLRDCQKFLAQHSECVPKLQ